MKGGQARLDGESFINGVIEFDLAFSGDRGFMGGTWRIQDAGNREEFYVRPHQSGKPDANQYTPIFNGSSGWQLYHGEGYGAPVVYTNDAWLHVKIVFSGRRGEVYLGDMTTPAVVIQMLKRDAHAGAVGLMCGNFAPAWFANFSFQAIDAPKLKGVFHEPPSVAGGTVTQWMISTAFDEATLDDRVVLSNEQVAELEWVALKSEPSGTANIAEVRTVQRGGNTIFARVVIESDRARVARVNFGYSDRVRAYLNGRLIYRGSNDYRSRDYRYLGTIGDFDELYLPLNKGRNEWVLAVSESFGGWGVRARFADLDGLALN
jgi:hypothetical protein